MKEALSIFSFLLLLPFNKAFNVEIQGAKLLKRPQVDSSSNSEDFFGYSFNIIAVKNSSNDVSISALIGSPKKKKASDNSTVGLAPILKPEFGEDSASGEIYSCAGGFDDENPSCTQVRPPPAEPQYPPTITHRDAIGLDIDVVQNDTDPLQSNLLACTPNEGKVCPTTFLTTGTCYSSSDRGQTWATDKADADTTCPETVDLIFVLDGSRSVGDENFRTVLSWVKNVSADFDIGDNIDIGVIQYSSLFFVDIDRTMISPPERQRNQRTEIQLGKYRDHESFEAAVNQITLQSGSTYTAYAVNKTVSDFMDSKRYLYPTNRKIAVLLTDGEATDNSALSASANYARNMGITFYAVGVGDFLTSELLTITGTENADENNTQVFGLNDFSDLSVIVDNLQRSISGLIEGGSSNENATNELYQAQVGFSSVQQVNGALYLGAVGAYDWSGTILKYDSRDDDQPDIPDYEDVKTVLADRTKESYLGYSIETGFFNGKNQTELVAIGAPRYRLKGAVVIFRPEKDSKEFTDAQTIYPNDQNSQLGSYFGGSLLAMDLNADGRDDLLVGAPLFIDNTYDDGRVYVYIAPSSGESHETWAQPSNPPSSHFKILSGGFQARGSRFGTAMAPAGDLNDDGFLDVIIGAPYLNGNKGAIFVFHGSADGIDINMKQVIQASDIPNAYLSYFGLSIQGGEDLDNNGYPDIAVGAPKSDAVIIFRTRPVAKFNASLRFNIDAVDVFHCFSTSERACNELTVCLRVEGFNVEPSVNVTYDVEVDTQITNPDNRRIQLQEGTADGGSYEISRTVTLVRNTSVCWNHTVYVKNIVTDFNTPIQAVLTYMFSESHRQMPLSSMRDPFISNEETAMARFETGCSGDVCDYNLGLSGNLQLPSATLNGQDITQGGRVLIISEETATSPIIVRVNLSNTGENAFGVRIFVNYSSPISWNNLDVIQNSNSRSGVPCIVDAQLDTNDATTRVKVLTYRFDQLRGNILPRNNWCFFEFNLSSNTLSASGRISNMRVSVTAGTGLDGGYSQDVNGDNNKWADAADIRYRADAEVPTRIQEFSVPFNFTNPNTTITSVQQIGEGTPRIDFSYTINGRGPSNIPKSTFNLSFPYRLPMTPEDDNLHLLYLYAYICESPEENAKCECDDSFVNPYNLSLTSSPNNGSGVEGIKFSSNPAAITNNTVFNCSGNENESPGVCATLPCTITNLGPTSSITFRTFFRFWTHSLNASRDIDIRLISQFQFSTEDSPLLINKNGENITLITLPNTIVAEKYVQPVTIDNTISIWIYIGAAIGGLVLLIVVTIILWKCGFFKSKYAEMKEDLQWTDANREEEPEEDEDPEKDDPIDATET